MFQTGDKVSAHEMNTVDITAQSSVPMHLAGFCVHIVFLAQSVSILSRLLDALRYVDEK